METNDDTDTRHINAQIHAPFDGFEEEEMKDRIEQFIQETGLGDDHLCFLKGAFIAQNDRAFSSPHNDGLILTSEEEQCLLEEKENRWRHPRALWQLVALCAVGAAVQGWDESAVDGAQTFYIDAFGIGGYEYRIGLVASAPYLCCVFSCWLTQPLNKVLGRRGTIFFACIFSSLSCLAQAFSKNWKMMVGFRILLGLGIGPKSATIPIYASECAPANIRGALVMFWQFFTAFGIMMGYFSGAAFRGVLDGTKNDLCPQPKISTPTPSPTPSPAPSTTPSPTPSSTPSLTSAELQKTLLALRCSLNWRLMVAAPMVAPIFLAMYIFTQPESPRWLLAKAHKIKDKKKASKYYLRVFQSLIRLRNHKLLAARDMLLIHYRLLTEDKLRRKAGTIWYKRGLYELFSIRRNRRAITASLIVMFFQQFCGINVLIYYSSFVLQNIGFSASRALLWSTGVGIINFVFAIPAFYMIDTFGRRSLLLLTFPFLALFQLFNAIAFRMKSRGFVIAALYLFAIAYSPGEGPVPFVYSAESMPLYIRDLGMGLVTSVLWFFYFIIGFTWPSYVRHFDSFGAFIWYSAWCIIGLVLIYFLVPETKGKELEDLDEIFKDSTKNFAESQWRQGIYAVKRYLFRLEGAALPLTSNSMPTELAAVSNPYQTSREQDQDQTNGGTVRGRSGL